MSLDCQAKISANKINAIPTITAISITVQVEEEDSASVRKFILEIIPSCYFSLERVYKYKRHV